jgi:glycyl-tRNA synthetase
MLDKVERIVRLTSWTASQIGLSEAEKKTAQRAAYLSKADLATSMVVEMTSLQGEMGKYYALHSGEPEAVAEAILDHQLPRFSGDALPGARPGLAVGLADRLDTLAGSFAIGLQPTGARDPFGLRRTAIGLVQCLTAHTVRLDLREALRQAASGLPMPAKQETLGEALSFVINRHEALLLAEGKRFDVVAAVLAAQGHDSAGARAAVEELEGAAASPDWPVTLQAYARCARILRGSTLGESPASALRHRAEKDLDEGLRLAESKPRRAGSVADFLETFRLLVPAITAFFEDVLVMSEDPGERRSRLGLLRRVTALTDGVADLSKLEGF